MHPNDRRRMNRRLAAPIVAAVFTGSMLVGIPPASALCHIAAFTQDTYRVEPADGGVEITVELVGRQPGCAGDVAYETRDGTAMAGVDYEETQGELTFVSDGPRTQSFTVPIIDDGEPRGNRRFTVHLSRGTNPGAISPSSSPATVVIVDDDPPGPEPEPADDEAEEEEAREPEPEMEDEVAAAPLAEDTGGAPVGLIVALIAIAAVGAGLFAARRFRRT